jgi:hypothetical protein
MLFSINFQVKLIFKKQFCHQWSYIQEFYDTYSYACDFFNSSLLFSTVFLMSLLVVKISINSCSPEALAQLAENAEIVRPDIYDWGSIPCHSTLCVWVYDGFNISSMYPKKKV